MRARVRVRGVGGGTRGKGEEVEPQQKLQESNTMLHMVAVLDVYSSMS